MVSNFLEQFDASDCSGEKINTDGKDEEQGSVQESSQEEKEKRDILSKMDAMIALQLQIEELNKKTGSSKDSIKKGLTEKTAGGGDCALHASLGKSRARGLIECDAVNKRKELSEAVLKCKPESPMFSSILEAIQAILMGEQQGFMKLREEYKIYLATNVKLIDEAWERFYSELQRHHELCNYIETKIKEKKEPHEWQQMTFRQKFHYCLDLEGGLLRCLIISVDSLKALFEAYNKNANEGFDLRSKISQNPEILREYAAYIARAGQWLLPLELSIVAYAFNITINYYIYNPYKGITAGPEILNPNQSTTVSVRFNGFGHFERIREGLFLQNHVDTKQDNKAGNKTEAAQAKPKPE